MASRSEMSIVATDMRKSRKEELSVQHRYQIWARIGFAVLSFMNLRLMHSSYLHYARHSLPASSSFHSPLPTQVGQ